MERRRFKRIISGFDAEIIYKDKNYAGVIDNLSENGVCVITVPTDIPVEFPPGTALKLKFQSYTGETVILNCTVKWTNKIPPHCLTNRIGMEIIDPPWDNSSYFL